MKKLDVEKVSLLSDDIFEYTIINQIGPEDIAKLSGAPVNDVRRLQSENPFVDSRSFELVRKYMDSVMSLAKSENMNSNFPDERVFQFFSDGNVESNTIDHKTGEIDDLNRVVFVDYLPFNSLSDVKHDVAKAKSYGTRIFETITFSSTKTVPKRDKQYAYVESF